MVFLTLCNYFFIDLWSSHGRDSHEIYIYIYRRHDYPSQLQSREEIITRKIPWGIAQDVMLMKMCLPILFGQNIPPRFAYSLEAKRRCLISCISSEWPLSLFPFLSLSCHPSFARPMSPLSFRLWGRWDLPALCWSCCTSRCARVQRSSLREAQVCSTPPFLVCPNTFQWRVFLCEFVLRLLFLLVAANHRWPGGYRWFNFRVSGTFHRHKRIIFLRCSFMNSRLH